MPKTDDLSDLIDKNYTYPLPEDNSFQSEIYKKREFYYHKIPDRPVVDDYVSIQDYREQKCNSKKFSLLEQQSFVSNFINPNTPYKGILIQHGTGTGKTCAAIAIAEKFKDMVKKYNTKIYVLVSGPLIAENWKNELLRCTGETYMKFVDSTVHIDENDKKKMKKAGINQALQYYKFMSNRSFYKKVLGDKIVDKKTVKDNKIKVSYRKTEEGDFERDIAVDRIYNLNNSLIIVDEAHGMTNNNYADALKKIINDSHNLKVVLLTATPMRNLADDIVELINFLRPKDSQIQKDKIFTSDYQYKHEMQLKPNGIDYLKKMTRGYISYLRGADPLTFAKKIDMGTKPKQLLFTKVVCCKMLEFQRRTYDLALEQKVDDGLDRRSEAVANFAFPGLSENKKQIEGYYGKGGLIKVRNQIKSHYEVLNKKISSDILKKDDTDADLLFVSESGRSITGSILKLHNLKYFSIKFYTALKKLSRLFWGKKGPRTAFIYSNLVTIGVELFTEVLLQNGYLEYQENPNNYSINSSTICYFCGRTFKQHQLDKMNKNINRTVRDKKDDESSSDYEKTKEVMPEHDFYPATFVTVTGTSSEDGVEMIPENKTKILDEVFNSLENKNGRHIKFVIGSPVMNEGISLMNVAEVHILDVYYNLGKVDQVIGRAIRHCSHFKLMNEKNPYPIVKVYKYAVVLEGNKVSSDIDLYRKAEFKYLLVKKIERALKEVAIDCPLNRHGNIYPEEIKTHANCCALNRKDTHETVFTGKFSECLNKDVDSLCPALCDFMKCEFKCDDSILNNKYYDPNRKLYKRILKDNLDTTTFTNSLARNEIETTKKKIKDMYRIKYAYTLNNILNNIKNTFKGEKRDLFDEFFVFKALDELIPTTENDFNNFKDTILDKFNRQGYLIFVDEYYIFQPFDQNEDVPMYYRTINSKPLINRISLSNYIKNNDKFKEIIEDDDFVTDEHEMSKDIYDFDSIMEYYDSRDEFKFVGIIDKEAFKKKSKRLDELNDVFKIREKREKILDKKRGTGIPSLKGAVCSTSKSKEYLEEIAKYLKIKPNFDDTRINICNSIKEALLQNEKYQTGKNKITYIMIPSNHPKYQFPYNLEDRIEYIKKYLNTECSVKNIDVKLSKSKDKKISYKIEFNDSPKIQEHLEFLNKYSSTLNKNKWTIVIE